MLQLSKKTEYSILALNHISQQRGRSVTVKELAHQLRISRSLLAKLLQEMARQQIVASSQGAAGGYTLKADLHTLSLMDLVEMIDGPVTLAPCRRSNHTCARQRECRLKKSIVPVERQVRSILKTVKVADL